MKSRFLLPFVLLASFGMVTTLASCTPKVKEEVPEEGYDVAITNKDALLETWYAGTSRNVDVDLTPVGNVALELNKGNLKVESSNADIVKVTGLGLSALAEGNATLTVKYHGHKDSVDLKIEHKQTIKEKYEVAHEGTATDPLTNEEAIAITKNAKYADGQEDLYVGGKIASFYHNPGERTDGAVSWFLEPAEGQTEKFEIYKCYKEGGTSAAYFLTDNDVWKGGYAIAHGRFTTYNGQCETSAASFLSCEGNKPQPRTTIEATFAEALAAGKALEDGDSSWDYYQFTAFATKQTGSNYFLTATKGEAISDEKENTIEIYGAADDVAAKLLKNAEVTVKMILKNYHGQIENGIAVAAADVTVVTPGTVWVIPEHTVTVAQGIEVVNGLTTDNQYTDDLYILSEVYVKAVTEEYSSYGNMSFTVADTADGTDVITVFRAKTDAATAAKVVAGAQVTVKGNLQKNVYNNVTAPYLRNVESITVKGGEGGGEQSQPKSYEIKASALGIAADVTESASYTIKDGEVNAMQVTFAAGVKVNTQYDELGLAADATLTVKSLKEGVKITKIVFDNYKYYNDCPMFAGEAAAETGGITGVKGTVANNHLPVTWDNLDNAAYTYKNTYNGNSWIYSVTVYTDELVSGGEGGGSQEFALEYEIKASGLGITADQTSAVNYDIKDVNNANIINVAFAAGVKVNTQYDEFGLAADATVTFKCVNAGYKIVKIVFDNYKYYNDCPMFAGEAAAETGGITGVKGTVANNHLPVTWDNLDGAAYTYKNTYNGNSWTYSFTVTIAAI